MNFLHRNKKVVSAGAFTESAYEVLNYEQLLKVNGAGGGSGGSGGGGPSGPSSSSGSSSSSSGYGSCGGSTISSGSGYSSCGGGNNSTNSGYSSCGGGAINKTSESSVAEKINESITENWQKKYDLETGYRCDNWVEEVIDDAGLNSSKYLKAGCASEKTVQENIDALKEKGTEGVDYTKTLPKEDGAYVVFMDDGTRDGETVREHCAILVIDNGKKTIYDNSSGNGGNAYYKIDQNGDEIKDSNGNSIIGYYDQGVGSTPDINGKNNDTAIDGWCYSTYYYQKIQ